jgi:chemotaxis protein CheZ
MQLEMTDDLSDQIRAAVRAELGPMFAELHSFVDRRIAELSAELNASVQLVDMTEEKLTRELATIHEQITSLVAVPAASARSSGVELEAVVHATEAAANTIMEATEAIQDWIQQADPSPEAIRALSDKVNSIFEACAFQDITGQRIRRAIQHLQQVETMLENILPEGTVTPAAEKLQVKAQMHTLPEAARGGSDLGQADIDALLNS